MVTVITGEKNNVLMAGFVQNVFQNHDLKQVTARQTFQCPVLYRKTSGYAAATRDGHSLQHTSLSEHTHTHTHSLRVAWPCANITEGLRGSKNNTGNVRVL